MLRHHPPTSSLALEQSAQQAPGPSIKLPPSDITLFHRNGYLLLRSLFSPSECQEILTEVDRLYAQRSIPGCFNAISLEEAQVQGNVLLAYPRMMHPHRISPLLKQYLLHPQITSILTQLLGEEPIAAQSMFYWKPPTALGQAFHQDNFYLRVHPGTCIAAWVALDEIDEENGCLFVAPGSHLLDIVCPETADPAESFTKYFVPIPEGLEAEPLPMHPGDVLFFGGNLIHGSFPNRSTNRFRRCFIGHYAGQSAHELAKYYFPLYDIHGNEIHRAIATGGGPCGTEAKGPH